MITEWMWVVVFSSLVLLRNCNIPVTYARYFNKTNHVPTFILPNGKILNRAGTNLITRSCMEVWIFLHGSTLLSFRTSNSWLVCSFFVPFLKTSFGKDIRGTGGLIRNDPHRFTHLNTWPMGSALLVVWTCWSRCGHVRGEPSGLMSSNYTQWGEIGPFCLPLD